MKTMRIVDSFPTPKDYCGWSMDHRIAVGEERYQLNLWTVKGRTEVLYWGITALPGTRPGGASGCLTLMGPPPESDRLARAIASKALVRRLAASAP